MICKLSKKSPTAAKTANINVKMGLAWTQFRKCDKLNMSNTVFWQ